MKKFPLEPLVKLRSHAVAERSDGLREQMGHVHQAQLARAAAELKERQHETARRDVEVLEQRRLSEGGAIAQDFQLLAQFRVAAAAAAANLRQQSSAVQQRLERAERGQTEAEQALAEARAEQRVIQTESSRFVAQQRALAEAAAEEESLEVWGSRRV